MRMPPTIFVLWDARAFGGNTDDALALCTADTEAEACRLARDLGMEGIWYEYDRIICPVSKDAPSGFRAENERARYDLPPFNERDGR